MTTFRLGQSQSSNEQLLATIEDIEADFANERSFELEVVLGGALYAYVFNCVRGDARRAFLERIVRHWERALKLAHGSDWDVLPPWRNGPPEVYVRAILGWFLVREAPVRDLDKALEHLEQVRCATSTYVPELCGYADALYKQGDYLGCAKMAVELQARVASDPEWQGICPPALSRLLAQAYRAEAKRRHKQRDFCGAAEMYEKLVDTGAATSNDLRLRDRLVRHPDVGVR
jgi:hypothetical protein